MSEKIGIGEEASKFEAPGRAQVETTQVFGRVYENARLQELAESLPVKEVSLDDVREAVGESHVYWEDRNGEQLAPFQIIQDWEAAQQNEAWADHIASIKRADLEQPIWMTKDGHVFDGVHRLTWAVINNAPTIKARIFDEIPDSIESVE